MDRQIVCFAIPSFEVAVARLNEPALCARPLAIARLNAPRSLLREISSEAEQEGLSVGMPLDHARLLCPSLHVLSPIPNLIHAADRLLLNVVTDYAPVWEPLQPGAFVMDVTGTAKLFGPACDVAAKVQQEVFKRYSLDGLVAVGSNKLVAQTAATLIEPSELYDVRPGSEQVLMSPILVRTLPGLHRPCMKKVLARLDELNLLTLGDVAESPLKALEVAFGDYARQLSRWAKGIDSVPVFPPAIQPSLEESIALDPDEIDDTALLEQLLDVLQRLCRTLRSQRRVCGSLSVTIRYSDQVEVTQQGCVVPETCWECDLSPVLASLFQRCFRRRIRLCAMTLCMTGLTTYTEQVSLFDEWPFDEQRRRERAQSLAVALDKLHKRFGEQAIRYGRSH